MFAFKTIVCLALPLFAVANPLAARNDPTPCNTGNLKCCNQAQNASDFPGLDTLFGLPGVEAIVDGLFGLDCNPITAIGAGSNTCQQNTLCCTGNNFGPSGSATEGASLISLDCTPINLIF